MKRLSREDLKGNEVEECDVNHHNILLTFYSYTISVLVLMRPLCYNYMSIKSHAIQLLVINCTHTLIHTRCIHQTEQHDPEELNAVWS